MLLMFVSRDETLLVCSVTDVHPSAVVGGRRRAAPCRHEKIVRHILMPVSPGRSHREPSPKRRSSWLQRLAIFGSALGLATLTLQLASLSNSVATGDSSQRSTAVIAIRVPQPPPVYLSTSPPPPSAAISDATASNSSLVHDALPTVNSSAGAAALLQSFRRDCRMVSRRRPWPGDCRRRWPCLLHLRWVWRPVPR